MGVTMRHSHSLQGGNNEAGRVEKGAIGCVALSTHSVTFEKVRKLMHTMSIRMPKRGELSFLGLMVPNFHGNLVLTRKFHQDRDY